MKVYLAAKFSWQPILKKYREELKQLGIEVTSRWLDEKVNPNNAVKRIQHSALRDVADVRRADMIVLFTVCAPQPFTRGGRHFETGVAYERNIPVVVVGPHENIFCYLPEIKVFEKWVEAKAYLAKRLKHGSKNKQKRS